MTGLVLSFFTLMLMTSNALSQTIGDSASGEITTAGGDNILRTHSP